AAGAQGIVAFPSLRKQIYAEAKAEHVTQGMRRPSLRLERRGNTVTASIWSMGSAVPGLPQRRMMQATAKFRVQSLPDGQLAKPVKQQGQVWHQIMYMNAHR